MSPLQFGLKSLFGLTTLAALAVAFVVALPQEFQWPVAVLAIELIAAPLIVIAEAALAWKVIDGVRGFFRALQRDDSRNRR